jgi:PBSX family phage terminase large subunit
VTTDALETLSLSRKQAVSIVRSTERVNVWHGSVRSSKTIASLVRWLAFVADAPRGGELVVVGRTRESIYRNLFSPLMDPSLFGALAHAVAYTAGAPTATVLGRRVHVLGASDARAEMVLRGLTVAGAYVDEATLVAEAFWAQLLARMSVPGAQLFATTNPDSPAHWFKREVVDRADELGYYSVKFTLDDNKWLNEHNPGYIAQLKREYTGLWYRRFILGEWVQAEGAVYDMWDPDRHVIEPETVPTIVRTLSLGLDYGTTNPTRGILLGLGRREGEPWRLYALDEWAPPVGLTDAGFSTRLKEWLSMRESPEWVYVDPAAASFKVQLFQDGFSSVTNGSNAVLPGIRTVASLLSTDRLLVSSRCERLISELSGYAWDPKATLRGEDAPIKMDDHSADALRYAIHSSRLTWRDFVPLTAAEETA